MIEKDKFYFIYETINLTNNKKYRGMHQTYNINDCYLGSGVELAKAINIEGKQNFKREILEFVDDYDTLKKTERLYVNKEWIEREDTYNIVLGGGSTGWITKLNEVYVNISTIDINKEKISIRTKKEYQDCKGGLYKINSTGNNPGLNPESMLKMVATRFKNGNGDYHHGRVFGPMSIETKEKLKVIWENTSIEIKENLSKRMKLNNPMQIKEFRDISVAKGTITRQSFKFWYVNHFIKNNNYIEIEGFMKDNLDKEIKYLKKYLQTNFNIKKYAAATIVKKFMLEYKS
jgi:hypothetical protein